MRADRLLPRGAVLEPATFVMMMGEPNSTQETGKPCSLGRSPESGQGTFEP